MFGFPESDEGRTSQSPFWQRVEWFVFEFSLGLLVHLVCIPICKATILVNHPEAAVLSGAVQRLPKKAHISQKGSIAIIIS